jgi:F0F1-type ATP synthase assembly protein I
MPDKGRVEDDSVDDGRGQSDGADAKNSAGLAKVKDFSNKSALALELPFTIVGAALLGAGLGYLLDHWLHTKIVFTLILGGLGFAGGVKEVVRRLS